MSGTGDSRRGEAGVSETKPRESDVTETGASQRGTGPARCEADAKPAPAGATSVIRNEDDLAINRLVKVVLTWGLILGAALLVAGFVVWMVRGGQLAASVERPAAAARSIAQLEPIGFFSIGLLVIILTPFVRVAGSVVVFLHGREWIYTAVTACVLLSMIAGLLIGAL